jgi:hypothetical protein
MVSINGVYIMDSCVNNFNPIIIAIAGLLSAQVPIFIGMLLNQAKIKHDVAVNKKLGYTIDKKTDIQTVILKNGFHGPPGPAGPPGPPGLNSDEVVGIKPDP